MDEAQLHLPDLVKEIERLGSALEAFEATLEKG